jgi:hypothetical protein
MMPLQYLLIEYDPVTKTLRQFWLDGADKVARDFVFSQDAIQFVLGQS